MSSDARPPGRGRGRSGASAAAGSAARKASSERAGRGAPKGRPDPGAGKSSSAAKGGGRAPSAAKGGRSPSAGKGAGSGARAKPKRSASAPAEGRPKASRAGGSKAGEGSRGGPARRRAPSEVSAGGVVVRGRELVVIVPTRRAPDGARVLALPKGHVDPGETTVQAAQREVLEEAGVRGEPIGRLGETRYMYRLGTRLISKVVSFYLFRYVDGDPAEHDHEVEEARWMSLAQAEKKLTHVGEREIVALARARLRENADQDR
jgi:8-oxo-dGTP pyrophosphatase MutT (NUDIX family)